MVKFMPTTKCNSISYICIIHPLALFSFIDVINIILFVLMYILNTVALCFDNIIVLYDYWTLIIALE